MNSRGFAELLGVAGSVLVPSASEPGLDLPLGEPALLPQAHDLTLQTHKHILAHTHAGHVTDAVCLRESGMFLDTNDSHRLKSRVRANVRLQGCIYAVGQQKNQTRGRKPSAHTTVVKLHPSACREAAWVQNFESLTDW